MKHNEVVVKRSRTADVAGRGPWWWRCWGTAVCAGVHGYDHHSHGDALREACQHIREHHS